MTLFKTLLVLVTFATVSCSSSSKKTAMTDEKATTDTMTADKKMMEAGYTKGTIVFSATEGDCPYTIRLANADGPVYFDPVNLEQEFKADATQVWFKYGPLKMMNRCEKANPVSIIEIQKIQQ